MIGSSRINLLDPSGWLPRIYHQSEISKLELDKGFPPRPLVIALIKVLYQCGGICSLQEANLLLKTTKWEQLEQYETSLISRAWEMDHQSQSLTDKLKLDVEIWLSYGKSELLVYRNLVLVQALVEQVSQNEISIETKDFLDASLRISHLEQARVQFGLETLIVVKWTFSALMAWIIGTTLVLNLTSSLSELVQAILVGGTIGIILGYSQYRFVLREKTPFAMWWPFLNAVAWGCGLALMVLANPNSLNFIKLSGSLFGAQSLTFSVQFLATWGIIGFIVGVAQWFVLRYISKKAFWWIPLTILCWILGWSVAFWLGIYEAEVFGAIAGMVSEIILAITLVWIFRANDTRLNLDDLQV